MQKALDKKMTELLPLKNLSEGTDIAKDILSKALENTMAKLRKRVESETNQILNEIPATGGGINVKFLKDRIALLMTKVISEDANMATNLAGLIASFHPSPRLVQWSRFLFRIVL